MMLEVNCETDFVAKNDLFLKFVEGMGVRFLEKEDLIEIDGENEENNMTEFDNLLG